MTTTVLTATARRVAHADLGAVLERTDIQSTLGPFHTLPSYRTVYPAVVVQTLAELYGEYNRAFKPLVEANRESETDYQHCLASGQPSNCLVQIDMLGLPQALLGAADYLSPTELKQLLRRRIFEIENSAAMYQLLENAGARGASGETFFKTRYRSVLAGLRKQFGKPIALLAVTEAKHQAMRETEFGKCAGEPLTDEEVFARSGFDALLGPDRFLAHLAQNGGECGYLLYARTSDPVAKLKDPRLTVEHPLLSDPRLRRIIKAESLTFNVDDPAWGIGDPRRINDTKAYMPALGMAYEVRAEEDLFSPELTKHLLAKKPFASFASQRLAPELAEYFRQQGIDPADVSAGRAHIRAKPAQGTYGCYGHVAGSLDDDKVRHQLRTGLKRRGPYMIQPELQPPTIVNTVDGVPYNYIDRVFFGVVEGVPLFLGGIRSLMPQDCEEARRHRNHGSASTVIAEIVCD